MDEGDVDVPEGFELVADETRARILLALSEAMRAPDEGRTLRFAELRRRTGVRDSGNFSYHLDRLRGQFVEEAPDGADEGYALTYQGMAVVAALVGGEYDDVDGFGPEPYGDPCPVCGRDLAVEYDQGLLGLACEQDESHAIGYPLPPHAVEEDSLAASVELMAERASSEMGLVFAGRCPLCVGEVTTTLVDDADVPSFAVACDRCGVQYQIAVGQAVLQHPAVPAFYADRGVDVRSDPLELLRLAGGHGVERVAEDPARLAVTIEVEGDHLTATVGEAGGVLSVERP